MIDIERGGRADAPAGDGSSLKRAPLKRRAPLKTKPESVVAFRDRARTNSRPISPASPAQRALVKRVGYCIVCGTIENLDPAHIIPRGVLSDGQDDPRAVVPLDRYGCHLAYDSGRLDLLPYLEQDGWREHLAFAVERFGLVSTLERVTGARWRPVERTA